MWQLVCWRPLSFVAMADVPISPGRRVLVWCVGREAHYHERLLLCRVTANEWMILTPDDDLYMEKLYDLQARACRADTIPAGLGGL